MTPNQTAVIEKVQKLIKTANELYNINCPVPVIKFDLKGTCAGQAIRRRAGGLDPQFILRFNSTLLELATEQMLNDTVPHEVAHTICQFNNKLGRGHDAGWQRVCKALGGNATRTHDLPVVYARGKTYEYVATCGRKVTLSEHYHKKLVAGKTFRVKNGGELTNKCEHRVIGINGNYITESTPAKKVKSAPVKRTGSKADAVRDLIAAAKAAGQSIDDVIASAMSTLDMARGQARTYVKNNWEKVAV
jgi:predicted SprT family Zn-dependent metalloprotease